MLCRSRKISPNRRRCEIPRHHSRGHDPPAPSGCPRWPRISFSVSRAQQRAGRGGFADLFDSPCLYLGHPLPGPHCVILYARSDALALLSAHPVPGSPEPYRRSHPAGTRLLSASLAARAGGFTSPIHIGETRPAATHPPANLTSPLSDSSGDVRSHRTRRISSFSFSILVPSRGSSLGISRCPLSAFSGQF